MAYDETYDIPIYSRPARRFHWWIVFFLLLQLPIGFYMTYRGYEMAGVNEQGEVVKGVWDGVTNTLYSSHKTIGLLVFALTLWRLASRVIIGRPARVGDLSPAGRRLAALGHAAIYLLLLVVPLLGYLLACTSPLPVPTLLFGFLPVPHAIGADRAAFALLRPLHMAAAILLVVLAAGHTAMAIRHHRAGSAVLRRMWRG